MDDSLEHYGTPRHSGRYPWGSGEDPYQRSVALKKYVDQLKKEGLKEKEISEALGFSSVKQYRSFVTISNSEIKKQQYLRAVELKEKGYSNAAIGAALKPPVGEGTVRNILNPMKQANQQRLDNAVQMLRDHIEKGHYVDLGEGTGARMGISETLLDAAKEKLRDEGYEYYTFQNMQQGTGQYTNMRVLCPPGTDYKTMYQNRDKASPPGDEWSEDGGLTISRMKDPVRLERDRIYVRYAEDGGEDRDGTIEIRRGVADVSLDGASYAQVRVAVEGDRYMKGMAFYSDDIPEGYDVVYNSNKARGSSDDKVFKQMKDDPDNPFGASISRQAKYNDAKGEEHQGVMNLVNEEGKWDDWARKLPAQFLAKQPVPFAKQQLDLLAKSKEEELAELKSLTNPVVKKQLLMDYADGCDSAAVSMEGAALPRQATKVLLPAPELKDNEIYAPGYKPGEEVALVRFPHAGTFEIPVLKVVDSKELRDKYAKEGERRDAVHINYNVAKQLSGADFDGDTVLVLPTTGQKIKASKPLDQLKNFTIDLYKIDDELAASKYPAFAKTGKTLSGQAKQTQMGLVSNLITDMTIRGAPDEDIAKAVKHSMVVIDAEKHQLDWKASEVENEISALKKRYQIKEGGRSGGASTLLSAGTGKVKVPSFDEKIDTDTGKIIRTPKYGDTYVNKKGETVQRTVERKRLSLIDDAYELSSGTVIESVYADHVNRLKRLAEEARREVGATKNIPYSPSAKKTYQVEVESLNAKLQEVQKAKPLERAAQAIASKVMSDKIKADPSLKEDKDKLKKARNQAQAVARARTGAARVQVDITPREWEAIQSGAVSSTTLAKILQRADKTQVRQYATPRNASVLTDSMTARIKSLIANGATMADVSDRLGVSISTVNRALDA